VADIPALEGGPVAVAVDHLGAEVAVDLAASLFGQRIL
jgi:hypothetical protein